MEAVTIGLEPASPLFGSMDPDAALCRSVRDEGFTARLTEDRVAIEPLNLVPLVRFAENGATLSADNVWVDNPAAIVVFSLASCASMTE